jgi:hypothetical protein
VLGNFCSCKTWPLGNSPESRLELCGASSPVCTTGFPIGACQVRSDVDAAPLSTEAPSSVTLRGPSRLFAFGASPPGELPTSSSSKTCSNNASVTHCCSEARLGSDCGQEESVDSDDPVAVKASMKSIGRCYRGVRPGRHRAMFMLDAGEEVTTMSTVPSESRTNLVFLG